MVHHMDPTCVSLLGVVDQAEVNALAGSYKLGIPLIDDQHRELFRLYVALRTAPDIRPVLQGLLAFAASHFHDEETWAIAHHVDVTNHHLQHERLVNVVTDLLSRTKLSRIETQSLVYDWLTTHIDVDDRALVMAAVIGVDD